MTTAAAGWIYVTVSALIIIACSHANHACQVISKQGTPRKPGHCEDYKPRLARLSTRFTGNGTHYFPQFVFETDLQRVYLAVVTESTRRQRLGRHMNKCVDTKSLSPAVPFKRESPEDLMNLYVCMGTTDCNNRDCAGECCDYQCSYTIDASACVPPEIQATQSTDVPTSQQNRTHDSDWLRTENGETTMDVSTEGTTSRSHDKIISANPYSTSDQPETKHQSGRTDPGLILGVAALVSVVAIVAMLAVFIRRDRRGDSESIATINVNIYPHEDVDMRREFFNQLHHACRPAANQTTEAGVRLNVKLQVRSDDRDHQRLVGLSSLFRKVLFGIRRDKDIYIVLCPRGTELFRPLVFPKLLGAYRRRENGQQDWQVLCSLLFRSRFMGRVLVVEQIETEDPGVDAPPGYKFVGELSSVCPMMWAGNNREDTRRIALQVFSMRIPTETTPTEYSLSMPNHRAQDIEELNLERNPDDLNDEEEAASALLSGSSVDPTLTDSSVGIVYAPPAKTPSHVDVSMADL